MCMFIPRDRENPLKPRVAEEDIKCFKIVVVDKDENIYSEFKKFPYQLNKTYTAGGNFSEIYFSTYWYYYVEGGGFHSFVEVRDVFKNYECYGSTDEEKKIIVKCHIPKGSLYYIGKSLGGESNYVSQSIIIDEIIYDN